MTDNNVRIHLEPTPRHTLCHAVPCHTLALREIVWAVDFMPIAAFFSRFHNNFCFSFVWCRFFPWHISPCVQYPFGLPLWSGMRLLYSRFFLFLSNLFFIFLFVLTWIGFVSQSFAISLPKSCSAVVIRMSCMSLHIRMHIVCLCLVLHAKLFYVYCFYIFAPGQCAHIYHRVFQCKLYAFAHFAMVKWILAHF